MRYAVLVACLSGCAQLFGLQETSGGGTDGATADAAPGAVTAQIQRISVGVAATRTPYDISQYPASFFAPDSSPQGFKRVAATAAADTWSATVPTGTPPIEMTLGLDLPDVFRREFAIGARNIKVLYGIYEQPDAPPATPGNVLSVAIGLPTPIAAGESYQLYCVGSWAVRGFSATEAPAGGTGIAATVPYADATWGNISGRPFTKILAANDEMLALRYAGNQLTGSYEFTPFDEGATNTLAGNLVAITDAAPMDVHVSPSNIQSRLAMPTPKGQTLQMSWSVNAAPGWEIANGTGPQLQAAAVAPADSGALTAPFSNPFAANGWKSVFSWSTNMYRTVAVTNLGNLPGNFYTGLNEIAEVAPGLTLDTPAPLPVVISINQMPLATDNVNIQLDPTKAVTLSLLADKTDGLFYQFNIYELRVNTAGTALEAHVAYVAVTSTTSVTIPNDVFVTGKTYFIRGQAVSGGYPGFATGDLWQRSLPSSVGYLDAGIFTVTAP